MDFNRLWFLILAIKFPNVALQFANGLRFNGASSGVLLGNEFVDSSLRQRQHFYQQGRFQSRKLFRIAESLSKAHIILCGALGQAVFFAEFFFKPLSPLSVRDFFLGGNKFKANFNEIATRILNASTNPSGTLGKRRVCQFFTLRLKNETGFVFAYGVGGRVLSLFGILRVVGGRVKIFAVVFGVSRSQAEALWSQAGSSTAP